LLQACPGIPTTATRVSSLAIDVKPAALTFSTTSPTPPVEQTITVTNTGNGVVQIQSVTLATPDDLSLPATGLLTTNCARQPRPGATLLVLQPAECATIEVQYSPVSTESITNQVVIASDVPATPTITVPITATNQGAPPLCGNPPVAQITASTANGPLPANGTTSPAQITFDASGSTAANGATVTSESWTLTEEPFAATSQLAGVGVTSRLFALTPGSYQVSLTVGDSNGCGSQPTTFAFSVSDTVSACQGSAVATITTLPPLGPNDTTPPAELTFTDDGSTPSPGSTILSTTWSLLSQPPASTAALIFTGADVALDLTTPGAYEVSLTITDSFGCISPPATLPFTVVCQASASETVTITGFVGTIPLTSSGVLEGTTVTLEGTDPTGSPSATYTWSVTSAPAGSTAALVSNGDTASLAATSAGTYIVQLNVTDDSGCSLEPATISIEVAALPPECGPSTQFIYLIDENANLYQFSPPTQTLTQVGPINCGSGFSPETMAVDRRGIAWIEGEGNLYELDTGTLTCWPSDFDVSQTGSDYWGSCFALNAPRTPAETYYIQYSGVLSSINPTTLALSEIGTLTGLINNDLQGSGAELTGTANGNLFGFFPSNPWVLAQIDKSNADILSQLPLPIITMDAANADGWAFASWGEDFWFFVSAGSVTKVFHYDASTATTSLATQIAAGMDGAGVSPCVQGAN
jgi:hypothetical protein